MYVFILPSSALQELEAKQYTQHLQLKNGSQTIHTAPSASQKMGARQYTQHLQVHKNWEPDNTHSTFSLTKKWELDNTHSTFSFTENGSQTIHTASSASQKMGARQYTQHLQLHKNWELDRKHTHTHTIFNTINSFTRTGN